MYHQVLIAIDASKESEAVLRKGVELANLYDAGISVLHVLELPMPMVGELALVDTYFNSEEYTKLIKDSLQELIKKVNLPESSLQIVTGMPVQTVIATAEKQGCDLIVTGSHGKNGFKLLLGSVASGILHKAKCDVFVYRIKA